MRYLLGIRNAIVLMELVLVGRMTPEERDRTEAAIADLRLAQADRTIWREMHTHPSKRAS